MHVIHAEPPHYHLHYIAKRLAGPLYGGLISLSEAKRVIADGR